MPALTNTRFRSNSESPIKARINLVLGPAKFFDMVKKYNNVRFDAPGHQNHSMLDSFFCESGEDMRLG